MNPPSNGRHGGDDVEAAPDLLIPRSGSSSAGDLRQLLYRQSQTPPPRTRTLAPPITLSSPCWQTSSTTPMTSRPHFRHEAHSPLRRVRSRSLGSAVDAARAQAALLQQQQQTACLPEYPVHFDDWRDLLLRVPDHNKPLAQSTSVMPAHKRLANRPNQFFVPSVVEHNDDEATPLMVESPMVSKLSILSPPGLSSSTHETTKATNGGTVPAEMATSLSKPPNVVPSSSPKATRTSSSQAASPTTTISPHHHDKKNIDNPAWLCIMYGLINATIVLPVLMSFASIIYRNPAFAPAMPTLTKLTLVSGMVHQVCFSTFSSLPFAVGQVQDAGLIFLSSMATTIVDYCAARQYDLDTLLATATICIPLATTLLGAGLVLLGRWQLAQYVQLLPTSVVGGYLAYIGWFCGLAGVGLMAGGASEVTPALVSDQWYLIVPGVASGLLLYISVRTLRHMAVLPCGILLLLCLFYVVLWCRGATIADATEQGWIRQTDTGTPLLWIHTWDLMKFDKVAWGVLPQLFLTELSMIFVVALSSSLDVAAIEIELQRPLDYNHELQTVGLSNLVSGLTGGYTGSYIFSQSIFSLRAGIRSRLAGYVLALCQLIVFLLPFPILSYVPNFFFGSLLSLICVDLVYEWLWQVRDKVTMVEYVICLSTFGLIQMTGVEYGILLGVALYLALRKAGFDVGNKTDEDEAEGTEHRDSLVPMRKEGEELGENFHSAPYGALDASSSSL